LKGGEHALKQILKKINWMTAIQLVVVSVIALAPLVSFAALGDTGFNCPAGQINCSRTTDANQLIERAIGWILSITFAIAVLFLILGGFWYITSAGNETLATKGKQTVINAIIGIVIIILAYVVLTAVVGFVSNTATP
jgi:lysylphosphatidylglycerol synthetase-like protein (DUF2156 family)